MTQNLVWEYSAGNSITFKPLPSTLSMSINRLIYVDQNIDGTILVTDTDKYQRMISFTSYISGADANTLHDQLTGGAIDYTGAYPRITTWTWVTGTTETNIEVVITSIAFKDTHAGNWEVSITMVEKTQ